MVLAGTTRILLIGSNLGLLPASESGSHFAYVYSVERFTPLEVSRVPLCHTVNNHPTVMIGGIRDSERVRSIVLCDDWNRDVLRGEVEMAQRK